MSLADRPYMREGARRQRPSRLDCPPANAIDMAAAPPWTPSSGSPSPPAVSGSRRSRRRLLGLLGASAGLFTLAWAVACGVIGASLHTEGGTFVSPAEASHGPR